MATNRYTQLSYSNLNDLPMLQLPFEALNNVILKAQQSKDEFGQLSGLTPKYIQESETDRNLASSINTYQNQLTSQLTDLASSGNTSEYRKQLGNAKNAIVDMWKPGGAAYALEQRHTGWEAEKKRIQEAMKDAPEVGNYLLKSYKFNDINYNPATREYSNIGQANFVRDVPTKEVNEWFNMNQDNIKDSLLNQGYSKKALEGVNTLHDFWQVKGVPFNKLVDTFLDLFPEEYTNSIFQRDAAARFFDPSRPVPETSFFQTTKDKQGNIIRKLDDEGNYVLNSKNPIAKLIRGQAELGERKNIDHDRKIVKDDIRLEREKKRLQDEVNYTPRESTLFNMPGQGIPELETNLDKDGFMYPKLLDGQLEISSRQRHSAFDMGLSATEKSSRSGKKAIDLFRDGTFAKEIPEAGQVYDKYKGVTWFKNLGDKEKAELLIEATNQAAKLSKTTNVTYNFPTGTNADKEINSKTASIVGKGKALGDIMNRPVFTITNGNVSSEPMNVNDIIRDYFGGDVEKFTEAARFKADIRGDNALMPSGDLVDVTYTKKNRVGKDEVKTITLLATQDNVVQSAIRHPAFIGNSVVHTPQNTTVPFETGIKSLDALYPKGIQTKRKTYYADEDMDRMADNIVESFEKNGFYYNSETGERIENKNVINAIANDYRNQASTLRRSPSKNTARNEIWVLDFNTGQEIGDESFWRDINKAIESDAAKYEK